MDNNENIEIGIMHEKVRALLMNNSRLRSFIWIPSYAIGNIQKYDAQNGRF